MIKKIFIILITLFFYSILSANDNDEIKAPQNWFNLELANELDRELEEEAREEYLNELSEKSALFQSPYDIELLLFEQPKLKIKEDMEIWPEIKEYPNFELAVGELNNPDIDNPKIILLPESEHKLKKIIPVLRNKGFYIHGHQMWRQDVGNKNNKTWFRVGSNRLDGIIHISKGRYLHINADFILDENQEINTGIDLQRGGSTFEDSLYDSITDVSDKKIQRIKLHRKMRGGELHYIDHPRIGLLIRSIKSEIKDENTSLQSGDFESKINKMPPKKGFDKEDRRNKNSLPSALPDPT
tara:strand:+ start:4572 stop:5465 length:894 start_codon:yes stop_codon:yes gene_type:complete